MKRSLPGFLLPWIGLFLAAGCDTINPAEEIPGYIYVDSVALETGPDQGVSSARFVDVWVSEGGSFRGTYELPARIPLLTQDEARIQINPGILERGGNNRRLPYAVAASFDTSYALVPGRVDTLRPTVRYRENAEFAFLEAFENPQVPAFRRAAESDPIGFRITDEESLNGRNLRAEVPPNGFFKIELFRYDQEVMNAQTVFLEMDMRNEETVFLASDVRALDEQGQELGGRESNEVGYFPSTQWRKVYINLTRDIRDFRRQGFTEWRLLVLMLNETRSEKVVQIDNLKVIYLP